MPIFYDPPASHGSWHSPCDQNPSRAPVTQPWNVSCEDAEGESALSSGDSPRVLWDDKVAYAPPDEGESVDSPRVLWDDNMVYAPPDQGESGESPRVLSRSPFRSSEDVRSPNTTLSSSSARSWSSEDDNEAYASPDEGECGGSPRVLLHSPFRSSEHVLSPNTALSSSSARSWTSEEYAADEKIDLEDLIAHMIFVFVVIVHIFLGKIMLTLNIFTVCTNSMDLDATATLNTYPLQSAGE